MRSHSAYGVLLAALSVCVGCASRPIVVPIPSPFWEPGSIVVREQDPDGESIVRTVVARSSIHGGQVIDAGWKKGGEEKITERMSQELTARFAAALARTSADAKVKHEYEMTVRFKDREVAEYNEDALEENLKKPDLVVAHAKQVLLDNYEKAEFIFQATRANVSVSVRSGDSAVIEFARGYFGVDFETKADGSKEATYPSAVYWFYSKPISDIKAFRRLLYPQGD